VSDAFPFDGGQVTARQLRKQVTAYSEGALQSALESGCQSVPMVMDFLARRDAEKQAHRNTYCRKGAAATKGTFKYARNNA
jgi:hypothetical protein